MKKLLLTTALMLSLQAAHSQSVIKALCVTPGSMLPTLQLQVFPSIKQATWGIADRQDYEQRAPYKADGSRILAVFEPRNGANIGFEIDTATGQGVMMGWYGNGRNSAPLPLTCQMVH